MKKVIRLTESDLTRIVKKVIEEQIELHTFSEELDNKVIQCLKKWGYKLKDTNGKYRFFVTKTISPSTKVNHIINICSYKNDSQQLVMTVKDNNDNVLMSSLLPVKPYPTTPENFDCNGFHNIIISYYKDIQYGSSKQNKDLILSSGL